MCVTRPTACSARWTWVQCHIWDTCLKTCWAHLRWIFIIPTTCQSWKRFTTRWLVARENPSALNLTISGRSTAVTSYWKPIGRVSSIRGPRNSNLWPATIGYLKGRPIQTFSQVRQKVFSTTRWIQRHLKAPKNFTPKFAPFWPVRSRWTTTLFILGFESFLLKTGSPKPAQQARTSHNRVDTALLETATRRRKNLATLMGSLIDEVAKARGSNSCGNSCSSSTYARCKPLLHSPAEEGSLLGDASVVMGDISTHGGSALDSNSADTPLSYSLLNYNQNLERYFQSQPKMMPSDGTRVLSLLLCSRTMTSCPLSLQDRGKAVERDRVARPTLNPTRIKLPIWAQKRKAVAWVPLTIAPARYRVATARSWAAPKATATATAIAPTAEMEVAERLTTWPDSKAFHSPKKLWADTTRKWKRSLCSSTGSLNTKNKWFVRLLL